MYLLLKVNFNCFKYTLIIILFFITKFSSALESDYSKSIYIESESGNINLKTKDMQIAGNVSVIQGSLEIHGNKINFKKEFNNNIISVHGSPATFQQLLDSKNRLGKNQVFKAKANIINYSSKNRIVTLNDKVHITIDDESQISCDSVIYNTISGKFIAKSNSKNFVNIIIYPKK